MNSRKEIMQLINELIINENGQAITADQKLSEAHLDSLGMLVFIMELDVKFPLLKNVQEFEDLEALGISKMTMKDLVNLCKSTVVETR